jgi:trehalose 6-phosphate synthase
MHGAIIVNPYDIERMADTIRQALEMPLGEQAHRMAQMRQEVVSNNIYNWAADLLRTMVSIQT